MVSEKHELKVFSQAQFSHASGEGPGILEKELTVTRLNRLCDAPSATGQTRSPFYADIQKGTRWSGR